MTRRKRRRMRVRWNRELRARTWRCDFMDRWPDDFAILRLEPLE